jgi:hypothetical protein
MDANSQFQIESAKLSQLTNIAAEVKKIRQELEQIRAQISSGLPRT